MVELETGLKLKAIRSDSARELVRLLKTWETDFSITFNLIEAYNSI